jgi:hypothetical protein
MAPSLPDLDAAFGRHFLFRSCVSGLRIRPAYRGSLPAWPTGFPQAAFNAASPAQILPPQFARMRENCGIVHKV